mmetsp:Transcript_26906/g.77977  ORF Transcript_26906/g.77977 Transcript_26906/m.77977 type:complete len:233 (-) Transcript_26906:738-1436(-)
MPTVNRPGCESVSPFSPNNFTTIIVDEIPQTRPQYIEAYGPEPKLNPTLSRPMKMATMTPAHTGNCKAPVSKTTRPIFKSALMSSSKPIMKSKKINPRELSSPMALWSCTMSNPIGPTRTPPNKYPRINGCCNKFTVKAINPHPVRDTAILFINSAVSKVSVPVDAAAPPSRRCSSSTAVRMSSPAASPVGTAVELSVCLWSATPPSACAASVPSACASSVPLACVASASSM